MSLQLPVSQLSNAAPQQQWQQQLALSLPNMIYDDDDVNITEKPPSRGGMAFYINFDDENIHKKIPSRLRIRQTTSHLTKEQLQARLHAAELRRKVKLT